LLGRNEHVLIYRRERRLVAAWRTAAPRAAARRCVSSDILPARRSAHEDLPISLLVVLPPCLGAGLILSDHALVRPR
jgi:hypothetical protein